MRIVVTLCLLAVSAPAVADEAADKAAAARLFQEGRTAITEGKVDEACAKFEASFALDPAIGTKLNLADCAERKGQLAAAYRLFDEAASEAARTSKEGREDFARQRASALAARLVKLDLAFAGDPPAGTTITVGGAVVASTAWRLPYYAMPGSIEVDVAPPTGEPFHVTVIGQAGETHKVLVPALAPAAGGTGDPGADPNAVGFTGPRSVTTDDQPRRGRTLAYVVGGGGVALLATSLALGLAARSKFDDAECGPDAGLPEGMCTPAGQKDTDRARLFADIGTGLGIAGVAAVGVGVYLFIRAGRGLSSDAAIVAPAVSDGTVGVVVMFHR